MASIVKRLSAGALASIFAFLSVLFPVTATAAVSSAVAVIPGYANGMYKAPAALSLVSNAFNVNSVINVGGKAVTVPAAMRLASNAPQFAVAAIRLNPSALVVGAVAAWLLEKGLSYADGQLKKSDPNACLANCTNFHINSPTDSYAWDHPKSTVALLVAYELASCKSFSPGCTVTLSGMDLTYHLNNQPNWATRTIYPVGQRAPDVAAIVPAVDADFAPLQTANLPDAVAGQVIQATPLPVTEPLIAPQDVPISQPRIDPETGRSVQDYARVTPSPELSNPLKVDVQTYTRDTSPTDGTPAPTKDKFPDDYNREVTQKDILKELKAEDAPEKPDWEADITKKKEDAAKEIKDKLDAIPGQNAEDKDKWFSWVWTPPVGNCQPIGGGSYKGATMAAWDICGHVSALRDVIGYMFAIASSILVYTQLFGSRES